MKLFYFVYFGFSLFILKDQQCLAFNFFTDIINPVTNRIGQTLNNVISSINPSGNNVVASTTTTLSSTTQPNAIKPAYIISNQCPICLNLNAQINGNTLLELTAYVALTNNSYVGGNESEVLKLFTNAVNQSISSGQSTLNLALNETETVIRQSIQSIIDAVTPLIQSNSLSNATQILNNIRNYPNILNSLQQTLSNVDGSLPVSQILGVIPSMPSIPSQPIGSTSTPSTISPSLSSLTSQLQNIMFGLPAAGANIAKTAVDINSAIANVPSTLDNVGNNIITSVPSASQGLINVISNALSPIVSNSSATQNQNSTIPNPIPQVLAEASSLYQSIVNISNNANNPIVQFLTSATNDIANIYKNFQTTLDNAQTNAAQEIAKLANIEAVLLLTLTAPQSTNCSIKIRKDISGFIAAEIKAALVCPTKAINLFENNKPGLMSIASQISAALTTGTVPIAVLPTVALQIAKVGLEIATIKEVVIACELSIGIETLLKTIEYEMRIQACNVGKPAAGDL